MVYLKTLLEKSQNFLISVQIDPTTKPDPSRFSTIAFDLLSRGIRLVDINSSASGVKHDSLFLAGEFRRFGFATIPHITPRDSSTAGILSQFLGAYTFADIKAVLVISGDRREGSEPDGVYETDSIGLIKELAKLRAERKMDFMIGCAFDQTSFFYGSYAVDSDVECSRLLEKKSAGADFIMIQPLWRIDDFVMAEAALNSFGLPVFVGVWPIFDRSVDGRMLGTLEKVAGLGKRKLPGIVMPNPVFKSLRRAKDIGEETIKETAQLIKSLKARVGREGSFLRGIYLVAPFRKENFLDFYHLLEEIQKE